MYNLSEARDLEVYKGLLRVFGKYSERFPATGCATLFKKLLNTGLSAIPRDKRALKILSKTIGSKRKSVPSIVQYILNARFADLPIELRPIFKNGRAKEVAFWDREGKISDKVIDLIDFEGKTRKGSWANVKGANIELIDLSKEDKGGEK